MTLTKLLAVVLAAASLHAPALAQEAARRGPPATEQTDAPRPAPADRVTRHTLALPGRTLAFAATAGVIVLTDEEGRPRAEVGFTAYTLDGADPATRPVTFAINGGPGASSAWLHLGMMGPWRVDMEAMQRSPSTTPALLPNAETWLDFTDLVFIDPPGTGFARILARGDEARRRIWSVDGDTEVNAAFIRRWLTRSNRLASPKLLVGESYGGFRGPRVARALAANQGVALSGLVLLSPVLDFAWRVADRTSPLPWISTLPVMAATERAARGPVRRADLADAEAYARGEMVTDLLASRSDRQAADRLAQRVATFTGLEPALVARVGGRVENWVFQRERNIARGLVASGYDATVTGLDPNPQGFASRFLDPILDRLQAPLTSAAIDLYGRRLEWLPLDTPYQVLSRRVNGAWQWGQGLSPPDAVSDLAAVLALDPAVEVMVAHGLFDLVTSYFQSALLLDQIPPTLARDRVRLVTFEGGHMFYEREASRRAMREEGEALVRRLVERGAAPDVSSPVPPPPPARRSP
jgi:carboxypeptidase C (cathepsin A)